MAVPVDLGELVRSVSSDLDVEFAAAGARVEVGVLPIVLGDVTAWARLFGRLLGDVVLRACPDGLPVMSVKAAPHHHGLVRIRVAWEVRQPSLASRKTTRIGQSDLSVMLCRRLLRPHGGTLDLDSETGSGAAEIVAPCGQLKPAEDAPV